MYSHGLCTHRLGGREPTVRHQLEAVESGRHELRAIWFGMECSSPRRIIKRSSWPQVKSTVPKGVKLEVTFQEVSENERALSTASSHGSFQMDAGRDASARDVSAQRGAIIEMTELLQHS